MRKLNFAVMALTALLLTLVLGCDQPLGSSGADATLESQETEGDTTPVKKVPRPPKAPPPGSDGATAYQAFFLPPLTAPADLEGATASDIDPQVRVITAAGEELVVFTSAGQNSERVRLEWDDELGEYYIVNFHLRRHMVKPGMILTVQVTLDDWVIGSIDLEVIANGAARRHVDTERYVPVVAARTVPVKFRVIEIDLPKSAVPPAVVAVEPQPSADDPVVVPDSRRHQLELEAAAEAAVFYRTVLPVPQWIDLNQKSGLVDVHTAGIGLEAGEKRQATVEFYSSYNKNADLDPFEGSTFDRPFPVTFYIEGESSPSE